jgi:hypothetical protein
MKAQETMKPQWQKRTTNQWLVFGEFFMLAIWAGTFKKLGHQRVKTIKRLGWCRATQGQSFRIPQFSCCTGRAGLNFFRRLSKLTASITLKPKGVYE